MSNEYDDFFEIVRWDNADWDRKQEVENPPYGNEPCFAVLKNSFDETGLVETIDTCTPITLDGRWSSTIMTDQPSVGDNFSYVTAPGQTETNWGTEFSTPYTRITGPLIDSQLGLGMFIGPDGVNAANIRRVVQNDQDYFGHYSGDNCFLVKFQCQAPAPGPLAGYYWRFDFLTQNCGDAATYTASAKGYYVKFIGGNIELRWFDNAAAVDVLLQGPVALAATPYLTSMVLCVIVNNDQIDVFVDPAGTPYPGAGGYVSRMTQVISALPGAQQQYNGTVVFESLDTGTAANETHGAEIEFFTIYGRPLDYDAAGTVDFSRFSWGPHGVFPIPPNWTDVETYQNVYRSLPAVASTAYLGMLRCRNKIGNVQWNAGVHGDYRSFIVNNQPPICILKIPRMVLLGVEFNVDLSQSFDPEYGNLQMGVKFGDDTKVMFIDTNYIAPLGTHKYMKVSNPIDGGEYAGDGYPVEAVCRDEAGNFSDRVTGKVWVSKGYCLEELVLEPLAPFEAADLSIPESGFNRNNAPFFASDIITSTFSGLRSWAISGKHLVVGADAAGLTPEQLKDMVQYESLLWQELSRYGVIFKLDIGDGNIVRGFWEEYEAYPQTSPHYIEYKARFSEVFAPWKSFNRDLVL